VSDTSTTYGPTALATPANAVTIIRMLVSPVIFTMIARDGYSWSIFALWVVLAGTDGVDGWVARRHGTTLSGAWLDPLADKVLVLGAMYALVSIGRFVWVPVAIIAARELFIQLYRAYWGKRGVSIPARGTAKIKTFLQAFAVGFAVFPLTLDRGISWPADLLLWASVLMAVVSAVQYVLDGRVAASAGPPLDVV
jgi:CDP-diacylglycerol--glycerol-3-phosphate 3-phosphatidyltransferase